VEEMLTEVRQIQRKKVGIPLIYFILVLFGMILLSCVPMIRGACACVSGCRWFYKRQPIATILYATGRIVWKHRISKSITIRILARIIRPIVTAQLRTTNDVRSICFCDVPGVVSVIPSVVCVIEVVALSRFHYPGTTIIVCPLEVLRASIAA